MISNALKSACRNCNVHFTINVQSKPVILRSVAVWKNIDRENIHLNDKTPGVERIVGSSTSILNLRWLLSEYIANVKGDFKKVLGSEHPVLSTMRDLLVVDKKHPSWGFITLLISKVAGHPEDESDDAQFNILQSQRDLAEVTESLKNALIIHNSIVNNLKNESNKDLHFGNRISVLGGDFLLSKSHGILAKLRNNEVLEIMSSALRDLIHAEFLGPRDLQNFPLPAKPKLITKSDCEVPDDFGLEAFDVEHFMGQAKSEWTLRNILGGASLLAKSCMCVLKLNNCTEKLQKSAYIIGKNLALAWKASSDLMIFEENYEGPFSLIAAPVLFQLEIDPSLYQKIEIGLDNIQNVLFNDLRECITRNGYGLEKTKKLKQEFILTALQESNNFTKSDAKLCLENIIRDA